MRSTLFFLLIFCVSTIVGAQSYSYKIDQLVHTKLEKAEQLPVIVQFYDNDVKKYINPRWTKKKKGRAVYSQGVTSSKAQESVQSLLSEKGIAFTTYTVVNAIAVVVNTDLLRSIAAHPEVEKIVYDMPFKSQELAERYSVASIRNPEPEWGVRMIRADSVWKLGYRGTGVVIGGQDTGYDWDVSPLKEKYRGWKNDTVDHNYNWHDAIHMLDTIGFGTENPCGLSIDAPCDDNNHGTHTMGTMVGEDAENKIGVAPGAQWIGCRNMEQGYGRISTYLECFEWFIAPYDLKGNNPNPDLAPHVVNNSWSCVPIEGCNPSNFKILHDAVKKMRNAGIVVVVAAGNSGPACGTISTPAAIFKESFTVGATTSQDSIAGFSSRGVVTVDSTNTLKPDVSAPGQGVRSVLIDGKYEAFSGTSMAAPHVAGAIALMINANPALAGQVDIIEDILKSTAVRKYSEQECNGVSGTEVPNATYGHGRIDALAAVEKALITTVSTVDAETVKQEMEVYPIPADKRLHIKSNRVFHEVTIYSMDGKMMTTKRMEKTTTYELDVQSLQRGMYSVCIVTSEGTECTKFVR